MISSGLADFTMNIFCGWEAELIVKIHDNFSISR